MDAEDPSTDLIRSEGMAGYLSALSRQLPWNLYPKRRPEAEACFN